MPLLLTIHRDIARRIPGKVVRILPPTARGLVPVLVALLASLSRCVSSSFLHVAVELGRGVRLSGLFLAIARRPGWLLRGLHGL